MSLYIKRKVKEVGIEEIFLDKLAQKREQEYFVSSKKLEVPLAKKRFFSLLVFGFLVLGFLAGFSFYLQAQGKAKYNSLSQQNKFINFNLSAERGIIYDRNLLPLVKNEATFGLWVKKSELPKENYDKAIMAVADIIKKPTDFISNLIDSAKQDDLLIASDLTHEQLVLLTAEQIEFPGFIIKKDILRQYQGPLSMSHILGYLGKISQTDVDVLQNNNYEFADVLGKEGLEKYYEDILKEKKGIVKFARTAQGKIVSQEILQYPSSGQSLILSIDMALQKKTEQVLSSVLTENGLKKGVVIILDPNNGEILTSVSWPAFDNNLFANGISNEDFQRLNNDKNNPQLNRAIAGLYPSGSALKPIIATAALEEGIINEKTTLYCPLTLCAPHQYDQGADCYPDNNYHGYTDVKRAIAESVNPFFYMIGGGYTSPKSSNEYFDPKLPKKFDGLGIMKIAKYLNLLGFGQEEEKTFRCEQLIVVGYLTLSTFIESPTNFNIDCLPFTEVSRTTSRCQR
ncbi:MAG: penicillin-binding transpeptidase domain-containing protein, partial [Patescibacteria group bacterium]